MQSGYLSGFWFDPERSGRVRGVLPSPVVLPHGAHQFLRDDQPVNSSEASIISVSAPLLCIAQLFALTRPYGPNPRTHKMGPLHMQPNKTILQRFLPQNLIVIVNLTVVQLKSITNKTQ